MPLSIAHTRCQSVPPGLSPGQWGRRRSFNRSYARTTLAIYLAGQVGVPDSGFQSLARDEGLAYQSTEGGATGLVTRFSIARTRRGRPVRSLYKMDFQSPARDPFYAPCSEPD